jgi:TonB family protein
MNLLLPTLLLFGALFFPPPAGAQDPHVRTRFVKETKTTIVETDWMYLVNTPQQFMQLGLVTRYPNERPEKPPRKINLVVWSFSGAVMYRENKGPLLKFNTDGESWSVSPEAYLVFKGETKNGQDLFWAEKRPDLGQPSLLPETARVRKDGGVSGVFMEQVFIALTPDQLAKIAGAHKVELQLGVTKLALTDEYLSTIRDFNRRLTPGAAPAPETAALPLDSTSPAKPGAPVDAGVVNGRAISLPRPAFPDLAKSAGASGSVNVFVTIDETGKVIAARAISGHPLLREASEEAARKARFSVTMINGQPVKVSGIIVYNFFR